MTHEYVLWIATLAYGVHMIEETIYNWHDWVRAVLKMNAQMNEFYLVNAVVALLGISAAMVGWRCPTFSLMLPAFMLFNAVVFHIAPTVITRVFSPGLFTALALFLPIGTWAYLGAHQDGVLTAANGIASGVLGSALMMFPIVLQKTKGRPMFQYESA